MPTSSDTPRSGTPATEPPAPTTPVEFTPAADGFPPVATSEALTADDASLDVPSPDSDGTDGSAPGHNTRSTNGDDPRSTAGSNPQGAPERAPGRAQGGAATPGTDVPVQRSHREILVIMGCLMTVMLLAAIDQTVVATALPTIAGELGGVHLIAWIVTAYLLAATSSTPLYGKISDVYGRVRVLQVAILIFVTGSVLSGLATSMPMLIMARTVQGAGGGGLMALSMTIIGDVVSPRERGRYQGYIGAVFGFASIVGPLLGGFIVDRLTWRWIFFVSLPVAIAALVVTTRVLKLPHRRVERRIDYLGALLLVAAVSVSLLVLALGGTQLAWSSPTLLTMIGAALLLAVLLVFRQRTAPEPIIASRLFRSRVFRLVTTGGFILGSSMFGTIVFVPVFLQLVAGQSATVAGLLMTPMMAGVIGASTLTGRAITRTGHYKAYLIVGAGLLTLAMVLLSTMDAGTSLWTTSVYLLVAGVALGCLMQNLMIAAQNDAPHADLGSATAMVGFFRSLGGAVGTAGFGAILAARVTSELARGLPGGAPIDPAAIQGSPATILALPPAVREAVVGAFSNALTTVFLVAAPLALLAFVLLTRLPRTTLRGGGQPASVDRSA